MTNVDVVVSCPIDTYSGYGGRSRDFVKALIATRPDWDVKILSQRWGNTRFGYLNDHNEVDLKSRIVKQLGAKPKIWIQITVPNEFQQVGEFNIGVTAGIETTATVPQWIEGINRMDLVITSSEHSKFILENTVYDFTDNRTGNKTELKTHKPISVLLEGVDENRYNKLENDTSFDLSNVKESFAFLAVGHWLKGDFGHDRKNIGYTIKAFLEVFKNKPNAPALLLKTSQVNSSIMDREILLDRIDQIRQTVKGSLPSIYLIHGEMSDSDMNSLYNHPKVKAMVSFTKGEGYGRPLAEFSAVGKPIIASNWSGHLDFLNKEFTLLVNGELEKVHPSAAIKDVIIEQASWFKVNDVEAGRSLKDVFKNYKKYIPLARKQRRFILDNFSLKSMENRLDLILKEHTPQFPELNEIVIPKLSLPKLTQK